MNKVRRLSGVLGALALLVAAATPVLATDIKDSQVPTDGTGFEGTADECADYNTEGMTLWHFLLNDHGSDVPTGGWGTVTLTATFTDENGATQTRTDTDSTPTDHYVYSFFVETPEGWTLTDASTDLGGASAEVLLSHVCFGPPPPVVSEAPAAILLPILAVMGFGLYLWRDRRRAASLA
jgi:hypothetical protein